MPNNRARTIVKQISRVRSQQRGEYAFEAAIHPRARPIKCGRCGRGIIIRWPMGEEPSLQDCKVCGAFTTAEAITVEHIRGTWLILIYHGRTLDGTASADDLGMALSMAYELFGTVIHSPCHDISEAEKSEITRMALGVIPTVVAADTPTPATQGESK